MNFNDYSERRLTDWKDRRTLWKDRNPQFDAFRHKLPMEQSSLSSVGRASDFYVCRKAPTMKSEGRGFEPRREYSFRSCLAHFRHYQLIITIIFRIGYSIYPIELINLKGYDFLEEP